MISRSGQAPNATHISEQVPKGCLVGVRLGEALKQRRLDGRCECLRCAFKVSSFDAARYRSASKYVFPKQDAKRRFEAPCKCT